MLSSMAANLRLDLSLLCATQQRLSVAQKDVPTAHTVITTAIPALPHSHGAVALAQACTHLLLRVNRRDRCQAAQHAAHATQAPARPLSKRDMAQPPDQTHPACMEDPRLLIFISTGAANHDRRRSLRKR